MGNTESCGVCDAQSDYAMCFGCLSKLRKVILGLQDCITELQVQVTRQDKGAPSIGVSGSFEPAMPFDEGASNAADEVSRVLVRWYRPANTDTKLYQLSKPAIASLLVRWHLKYYIDTGRHHTGPTMYADMLRVLNQSLQAVDRKESKIWIADCGCGRVVRSVVSNTEVVCKCGQIYNVSESREKSRELGAEQLLNARDAESLGELYGAIIKLSTIRSWLRRGQLPCYRCMGEDTCDGRHIFRFGDILDLHRANTKEPPAY